MSYQRLYATKNNTLFRYLNVVNNVTTVQSDNVNCGANPIHELQDGAGQSKLIWSFDIPASIQAKLAAYSYTAKLQLFDAGTLFQPAINLTNVTLSSFTDDFAEGDGYSFLQPANLVGVSNWNFRDAVNLWSATTFTPVTTYHLNTINEDLNFDITSSINTFVAGSNFSPKYALEITSHTQDNLNVYTKFICSKYTKTLFQPYIEFFIDDDVTDQSFDCFAGQANTVYLVNHTGNDFVGSVTAQVTHEGGSPTTPTPTKVANGVYYITITPPVPTSLRRTYTTVVWSIGGLASEKLLIDAQSPNQLKDLYDVDNLFFYPVSPYSHNIVRQGDIMPFNVVSQIRGKGDIVIGSYQYKVTSADGFEMIPYTDVSVYRKKMYFNIDTSFFYPEQQYEVWVRDSRPDRTITSNLTFKFKLAMNDKSHLRELSTSPYYSREQFISK